MHTFQTTKAHGYVIYLCYVILNLLTVIQNYILKTKSFLLVLWKSILSAGGLGTSWDFPADSRESTPWRPCSIRRHLKRYGIHSSQGFPKEPLRGLSAFTIYFLHSMSQIREGQHSHQDSQHRCSSKLTLSKNSQNLTNYSCEIDVPLKFFRKESIKL